MATRSNVAVQQEDGSFLFIYVHWDGYYEGNGQTLLDHYSDVEKARKLAALGDLSVINEEVGEKHDFNNPTKGWTVAYGRDRGESGVAPRVLVDVNAVQREFAEQYLYVLLKTEDDAYVWHTLHRDNLIPLVEAMADDTEDEDD
ncbi:hypothetical protein CcrColossus_gp083 [Caulobacter phage CcrColossus]|uniref:Uncharacterized protein n=1 Tax=Caulobacter phage CcrColossus TaxID=1211640 RepID=K4JVS3_9CAUD|nr:hypothetical protein CcrColossus_gp083 [Caulobacter phage CcrColossus]AFU87953.1 hypothetical protein CcrColossus_gp083 [Caulobacter phage CcrColossus]